MPNLMHNTFTFAGVQSDALGLTIEKVPSMDRPARKFDRYSVPGRNGDIFVMQDAWENVEMTYEVCWRGTPVDTGLSLAAWLFGSSGYQTLTDTYDPNHFRKAVFVGPYDVENILMRYGRATLTFDCDPRRFLNSGVEPITIRGGQTYTLTNPTPFEAKPELVVTGAPFGNMEIYVDDDCLTIADAPTGLIINCETEATYLNGVNYMNKVSGTWPKFGPGAHTVEVLPVQTVFGPTVFTISPKWWTL